MSEPAADPLVTLIGVDFIAYGHLLGAAGQRVSDHVSASREMLLLGDAHLQGCESFGAAHPRLGVSTSQVLFVLPDREAASAVELHVRKDRHRVRLLVDDYVVVGDVHLVPGLPLERFAAGVAGEFIPVTDAELSGPEVERSERLLLVRRRAVRLLASA